MGINSRVGGVMHLNLSFAREELPARAPERVRGMSFFVSGIRCVFETTSELIIETERG